MTTHKSQKNYVFFYIALIIAGCVFACSNIIGNDYIKLLVVMTALCYGLFGILKGLSHPSKEVESTEPNV